MSEIRFFNTLSRSKERFEPLAPPQVNVYSCGPTVYDEPHIGNYRFFVWVDVLHRYLSWRGFEVRLIMNITDVDDRTIEGAAAAGETLTEFTNRYADAFLRGLQLLGVRPAEAYPRATEHIPEMVELIERLLESGHAYVAGGNVFFRVASFPAYGALARLMPDDMQPTERVEGDEFEKEDPRDFALWKAAKTDEPHWSAPFGSGRPGWHLECSAMSMKFLGETFDLHLGGADLLFPHNENEIAQSEAATGQQFVRYWMHCSHLLVDGTKMSKSLGNFYRLGDLLEAGRDPVAIRYLLASVHYRRQLNFTFDALDQATATVQRLHEVVARLEQADHELPERVEDDRLTRALARARSAFGDCLDDDLNTAGALGEVFTLVRDVNAALDTGNVDRAQAAAALEWLRDVDTIWGVLPARDARREFEIEHGDRTIRGAGPALDPEIEALVVRRARARLDRDFDTADAMRQQLHAAGVEVEDTPDGVRWRLVGSGRAD